MKSYNVIDLESARAKLEARYSYVDPEAEAEEEERLDRRMRLKLEELYVEHGLGARGVAKELGIGHTQVLKLMRKHGIQRRPQMRHPDLRRDFFDIIDSPEKAYILGLIWADGTVSDRTQQVRIRLATEDGAILRSIADFIGVKDLHYIPPTGNALSAQVGLYISSKQIVESLANLGVIPAKDYKLPQAILPPKSLMRDFVRGLVDGDGCLSLLNHGRTPRISFRNRNASLRTCVSDYWSDITGQVVKNDNITFQGGQIYPSVYLSGSASVIAAKIMYDGSILALDRKRETALKFSNWIPHRRGRM